MFPTPKVQDTLKTAGSLLHRGFDATATWVTQLSWWKFLVFAALMLAAGSILQDELFSSNPVQEDIDRGEHHSMQKRKSGDTNILIDDSGIHFNPRGKLRNKDKNEDGTPPVAAPEAPEAPAAPEAPEAPAAPAKAGAASVPSLPALPGEEVHIDLPPQIGEELSNAIEEAVDTAAEQKVARYHGQASTWFKSFVTLLVLALFATKFLMGSKKRAEAETQTATAAAERESMQRQLSEAKMQMMQAQVEPHFLFNTLASVEHLIETDPPRASAMQRSLIKYLRAVLPQMRDNNLITNLGREADMVVAYLNLLKMRMEERLTVDFDIADGLRTAAFPPMMLQSMVENAIKHGLEGKPEGGTLKVRADVAHNKLRVIVTDDGLGFGAKPSDGTGLGLSNIRERLKLLHGDQGQLLIAANSPSGVIVTIEVPYQLAAKSS
ncbi:Histidine kinase-, DNA gyrase B-, and HSP90-like ATPase [Duganella sp. CF402]|uniref:sensor histidine kinase n=1 Tax=unclassified Duganella TaxID=2636909 RepID=UPI0008C375F3|nr:MULTISPECIES: histidine kinase [unclassified Duganella]RZT01838.1 histidine kinase [Duganella sp. BK701]SEN21951.1 Histidine kinase-, DNA gyrase B-, and HSP90-like ATPase [Duganella sp. CF402]